MTVASRSTRGPVILCRTPLVLPLDLHQTCISLVLMSLTACEVSTQAIILKPQGSGHSESHTAKKQLSLVWNLRLSTKLFTHEVYHQSVCVRSVMPHSLEPLSEFCPSSALSTFPSVFGHSQTGSQDWAWSECAWFSLSTVGLGLCSPPQHGDATCFLQTAEEAAGADPTLIYLFSRAGNGLGQLRDSFKVFQLLIERLTSEPNFRL